MEGVIHEGNRSISGLSRCHWTVHRNNRTVPKDRLLGIWICIHLANGSWCVGSPGNGELGIEAK